MNGKRQLYTIQTIRIVVALILFIIVIVESNWFLLVLPIVLIIQTWKKLDCVYCKAGFCEK